MHPFSLEKSQKEQVTGGLLIEKITLVGGCTEGGGIIPITMAIPEDGNDPRPFPPIELM